jgi:D-lactate dehydrogenase
MTVLNGKDTTLNRKVEKSAEEVTRALRQVIDPSRVLGRAIERVAYASDASFHHLVPLAVAQPASLDEIRQLFKYSRDNRIPITFRAGGTRVGGILSNNASGMCCGVRHNAYHTLRSMKFVLPSGTEVDTGAPDADSLFRLIEPSLSSGLLELKRRIQANPTLSGKIRSKYRTRNTTGYSLNAFLDCESAVQIFSHLLIGAEGTLGFIAEALLETIPDLPTKYTGLLLFSTMHAACEAILPLRDAEATALELMDRASLRSMEAGLGSLLAPLPDAAAGLLVEFQAKSNATLDAAKRSLKNIVTGLELVQAPMFSDDSQERDRLWSIRKGLFPSIASVRASGTTVIIEDVTFPVERLGDAAMDLRQLLKKHGCTEAVLFGHAKEGNLHFVITQSFSNERDVDRYRRFMDELVNLVVGKFDGALKGEHGTGRNMAPFVETEWGGDAVKIMHRLKRLVDPEDLLNPGVIINSNPSAHITDLKRLPVVEPVVDKCIEYGYCEPNCPSRDLTLTPRQRIVVWRELQRLKEHGRDGILSDSLRRDFPYMGLDTCAVDGLCAVSCPVGIDTGSLTKHLRHLGHSALAQKLALGAAKHFALVEGCARTALRLGHTINFCFGARSMSKATKVLDRLSRSLLGKPFWQWCDEMPMPPIGRPLAKPSVNAQAIYPSVVHLAGNGAITWGGKGQQCNRRVAEHCTTGRP